MFTKLLIYLFNATEWALKIKIYILMLYNKIYSKHILLYFKIKI